MSASRNYDESEQSKIEFMQRSVTRRDFLAGGLAAGGMFAANALLRKNAPLLRSGAIAERTGAKTLTAVTSTIASGFDPDGPNTDPGYAEAVINTYFPLVDFPTSFVKGAYDPNFAAKANQFVPVLAESWTREGPLKWIMKLRKGVISAAGNEFNADDVVYTFARAKSVSGSASNTWFLANVGGILTTAPVAPGATAADKELHGEVVALDRYTVRFTLFEHSSFFFMALNTIQLVPFDSVEMKKHATASDPWSHIWNNTHCAGYGPYYIKSWTPSVELVYEANPHWFMGKPKFQTVVTTEVAEGGDRLAALERNDAQIASYLEPPELATLKRNSSINLISAYTNQPNYLILSYNYAPWNLPNNKLLRQAVAYSIPYDEIINQDYHGFAQRMYSAVPPNFAGYKAIPTYKNTDLAKARSLMAEAGHAGGSGLAQYSSGLQMYFVSERSTLLEPIANQIHTNLAAIGLDVTIIPIPQADFSTKIFVTHDMPMAIFDFSSPEVPDAGFVNRLFFQSASTGGLVNPANYANSKFNALAVEASTANAANRATLLGQMQDIVMDDLPIIPLVEALSVVAMRKPYTGWYVTTGAPVPIYSYVET